jgi:ATP-dependent helicase IRC3
LQHFKVYEPDSSVKVWGCSATLRRHDGKSLRPTFEEIVYERTVGDMIKENWLCPVRLHRVKTHVDIKAVSTVAGDFNAKELSKTINIATRNHLIVQSYLEHCKEKGFSSTLVFAVDIKHINSLVEAFRKEGVDCFGLDSTTQQYERDDLIDSFKKKAFPVLINCGIITEGVDIPNIDSIILGRPTKSGVLMQQMLGRGMRLHSDKEYCLVLDFVDSASSDLMLATLPTLLGLEVDPKQREKLKLFTKYDFKKPPPQPDDTSDDDTEPEDGFSVSLSPFIDPFSRESVKEHQKHIRQFTMIPWVRIGEEKWVLNIPKREQHLVFEKIDNLYYGTLYRKKKNYTEKIKRVLVHDNFKSAIGGLDTFVIENFGYQTYRQLIELSWRISYATMKQIETLKKFGIPHEDITRGDAADLITRSIFGAKGNAKHSQVTQRKLQRIKTKFSW